MGFDLHTTLQFISYGSVFGAGIYAICKAIHYSFTVKGKRNDEYFASFNTIIAQLSSENSTSQLSAAILLRRFLAHKAKKRKPGLKAEAINEISSLLRVLPTGILQKTLGDGLAYAKDLSGADLQKTNMQDIYLGTKKGRINLTGADLFRADLSFANLDNIDASNAQLFGTILYNARIKNSNFTNACFRDADLYRVTFKNTTLLGADFTNALNVPDEIQEHLVDNIYLDPKPVTISPKTNGHKVFFSMPGSMSKGDELVTKEYKSLLEKLGYDVIYYSRDHYPKFGQLNQVRMSIESADAMIAFGLRQINIKNGMNRANTNEEVKIDNSWMPTPWNEIEVGMGIMAGLPILLVKDREINSGVFDSNLSECFVGTISVDSDTRNLELNKEFVAWRTKFSE